MSKAFDYLSSDLLLSKPQAYGLCSNSLALLKFYFSNRKNRVRLGDTFGEWKAVKRGCPQGSSLGPVSWNFYQNDLFCENIRSQLMLTLTTTKYIFRVSRSAPTLSNFQKGIRKTDIASLIDDSCNDCVLVSISSPHHFTLIYDSEIPCRDIIR